MLCKFVIYIGLVFMSTNNAWPQPVQLDKPIGPVELFQPLVSNIDVVVGQEARIRYRIDFRNYSDHCYVHWSVPTGVLLQYVGGYCPSFDIRWGDIKKNRLLNMNNYYVDRATCYFDAIIPTNRLNAQMNFSIGYHNYLLQRLPLSCNIGEYRINSLPTLIRVLPHPLSMAAIPLQNGTAGQPFQFDIKKWINYYQENMAANSPPVINIEPKINAGLYFDEQTGQVRGTPDNPGQYQFTLAAKNRFSVAAPVTLTINVAVNSSDKPEFRQDIDLPATYSKQQYHYDLSQLLKNNHLLRKGNQYSFRFDKRFAQPQWLQINDNFLEGEVPENFSGSYLTILARSNTGGDSEPQRLWIAQAEDPGKKITLTPFSLMAKSGEEFFFDIRGQLSAEAADSSLQLLIDAIEPCANWLDRDPYNKTVVHGFVPLTAAGMAYKLKLHVANAAGGHSNSIEVPLQIAVNDMYRPQFAQDLVLPLLNQGQAYIFDFVLNEAIYPNFQDYPYEVHISNDCPGIRNPSWLMVHENKLTCEKVPSVGRKSVAICLQIANTPGGLSLPVVLTMHSAED